MSNGESKVQASKLASAINFNVVQNDSVMTVDKGISITKQDKFRNQQVILTVAVPVGKRILINENMGWDNNVRVNIGHSNDYWEWENNMENVSLHWDHNVEYVMTAKGLERVNKETRDEEMNDEENNDENGTGDNTIDQYRKSREQLEKEKQESMKKLEQIEMELQKNVDTTRYRYQPNAPAIPKATQPKNKATADITTAKDKPNTLTVLPFETFFTVTFVPKGNVL
jgi:hypothetical protein